MKIYFFLIRNLRGLRGEKSTLGWLVASAFVVFLTVTFNANIPFLFKKVLIAVRLHRSLSSFHLLYWIFVYAFTWTAGQLISCLRNILASKMFVKIGRKISQNLIAKLFDARFVLDGGVSLNAAVISVLKMQHAIPFIFSITIFSMMPIFFETAIASLFMVGHCGWRLGGLFFFVFFVYVIVVWRCSQRLVEQEDRLSGSLKFISIKVSGALARNTVIDNFDKESFINYVAASDLDKQEALESRYFYSLDYFRSLQSLVLGLGLFATISYGAWLASCGVVLIEDFAMVNSYLFAFISSASSLSAFLRDLKRYLSECKDGFGVYKLSSKIIHQGASVLPMNNDLQSGGEDQARL